MRKLLLSLLMVFCLCSLVLADGPAVEGGNVIQFTAADQETTTSFRIKTIVWVSAAGSEISAADGFTLEDGAGVIIIGGEATAISDYLVVNFGDRGVTVSGLKAEDLDAGYLYIYGEKR